jgi:hypothetical protein
MRARWLPFVLLLVVSVLAGPSASASPDDTIRTVHVRGESGIVFGAAGVATMQVCDDTTPSPACRTYPVPASGDVQVEVDSARAYTVSATAYRVKTSPVAPLVGDDTVVIAGAGAPRTFTGTVTVNGVNESDAGLFVCPYNPPAPLVCTAEIDTFAIVNASGQATLLANSLSGYLLFGGAEVFQKIVGGTFYGAGTGTVTQSFDVVVGSTTTFTGTVTRTGFPNLGSSGGGGVYACPDVVIGPPVGPNLCMGIRYQFAEPDGSYRLRLSSPPPPAPGFPAASSYRVGGFIIIDGVPYADGTHAITIPLAGLGAVSHDFSADVGGAPSASVTVGATGNQIEVSTDDGATLLNVATVSTASVLTPVPPGVEFLHGVQSFTADLLPGQDDVTITLSYDGDVPANAQWYKRRGDAWVTFPGFTRVDAHTITLTITDGSIWDDDGVDNGYVTDPGALGAPIGNDAPVITVPGDIAIDAIGPLDATVTYVVSASDAEDGALAPSCDHESGSAFPVGATVVTCTASDGTGQSASASFTVTVRDVDLDDDGVRDTAPPSSKDQCKSDGWKAFNNPTFKNQGDCVSYVATGGKNPAKG